MTTFEIPTSLAKKLRSIGHLSISVKEFGVSPLASGPENRANLQAAEDFCWTNGYRYLDWPEGTYNFAGSSVNPFEDISNFRRYCILKRPYVYWRGRFPDTVIRWADDALTDAYRTDLILVASTDDCGFIDLVFDGNMAGNSTLYTGGYGAHQAAGTLLAIGADTNQGLNAGCSDILFQRILGLNSWWYICNAVRTTRLRAYDLEFLNCGAGFETNFYIDQETRQLKYRLAPATGSDDPIEFVNGTKLLFEGFYIESNGMGSCFDITGRDVTIHNGVLEGSNKPNAIGGVIQTDMASPVAANSTGVMAGVTARNFSQNGTQGFICISTTHATDVNFTITDCLADNCFIGYSIQNQPGGFGRGSVALRDSRSYRHGYAGLYIANMRTCVVRNGDFSDGLVDANGIHLYGEGSTAENRVIVDIEATALRNGRFAVFVEPQANVLKPTGLVKVNGRENSADHPFFGIPQAGCQFYTGLANLTGLELINSASRRIIDVAEHTKAVTGDQFIAWTHDRLRNLSFGTHDQEIDILFRGGPCRAEHYTSTVGNNISLRTAINEDFQPYDSLKLIYSATDQRWYELSRVQTVIPPLDITTLPGLLAWYKRDTKLYVDAAKTTLAVLGTDRVRAWEKHAGTITDLTADATGAPMSVVGGGIQGNSLDRFMTIASTVNLSGAFSIILISKTPTSIDNRNVFGFNMNTEQYTFRSANIHTVDFYGNGDPSSNALETQQGLDVAFGISVAADGTTTLFKPDGTSITSAFSTDRSATATLQALAGFGVGSSPAHSSTILYDIIIRSVETTLNTFNAIRGVLLP